MEKPGTTRIVLQLLLLIALVILFSGISTNMWGGKQKTTSAEQPLVFEEGMSVAQFGAKNNIPNTLLKELFNLGTKEDLQKKLSDFGISQREISSRVGKARALAEEHESKNWVQIPIKFALWIIFLAIVLTLMRRKWITAKTRKVLYVVAIGVFGVIMGSDPSPMGTVKDAIVLFGAKGVVFPPRLVALTIFLVISFIATKFICSWGCQFGTLQDLIFRLNRNLKDTTGSMKQVKVPFAVTNTIRVLFFVILTVVAFLWATDIVGPIDPFKIYKPMVITLTGAVFIGAILVAGLFIYRPWCHFFCPFGLVGWLVEKISIFKINVNYDTCIACESCAKACPSTVMNAILKQKQVIPDCFSCATCIAVCPTNSIHFQAGKRNHPPAGKFDKISSSNI